MHPEWIITAAHCIPKFQVEVDDNGQVVRSKQLNLNTLVKRYPEIFDSKRNSDRLIDIFNMTVFVGLHDTNKLENADMRRVSQIVPHPGNFCKIEKFQSMNVNLTYILFYWVFFVIKIMFFRVAKIGNVISS